MEKFMELIERCRGNEVYIQTHNFPDPDAIASAYGLQVLLRHFGIETDLCYFGAIDRLSTKKMIDMFHIKIYAYEEVKERLHPEDLIICVDSQKNGGNIMEFVGDEIACIDHHPTFAEAEYLYSDIRLVGSCATLIASYFHELDVPMDKNVATALLHGLKMDTAQFSRGLTALDIRMFEQLFQKADQRKLAKLEKNTMEFRDLKAYGSAIENIKVYDKVGIAAIPFACPDALIALVADFILSLEEVEVAIIYAYREKELKFSVRCEDASLHAGFLADRALTELGGSGGGHAEMSGGRIPREAVNALGAYPDDVIREHFLAVIAQMQKELEEKA